MARLRVPMLRVLSHYLPLRKSLLIGVEIVLLTAVIGAWMTAHLWRPNEAVLAQLYARIPALDAEDALARCLYSSFLLSILAQCAIAFNELYDVRISGSRHDRAGRFVESAGSALFFTLLAVLLLPTWGLGAVLEFPPLSTSQQVQTLVFAQLSAFAALYAWRSVFHWYLARSSFAQRVLVLGAGARARALADEIRERPDMGYVVVGLVPERARAPEAERARTPATGRARGEERQLAPPRPRLVGSAAVSESVPASPGLAMPATAPAALYELARVDVAEGATSEPARSLAEIVQAERVDLVAVALEDRRESLPVQDLLACRLSGVAVTEQEALYEKIAGKIAVEALRPSYLIFNEGFARSPWGDLSKRAFDLAIALAILLVAWPIMLATAVFVRLDSRGPILFRQERVGRDGLEFTLLKFRSMRADAEEATGPVWATRDDPRITRVGRWLRRARLDELPQLFNVLYGDMSIVGPRPERRHFVDELARAVPYFEQRHIVKPGLTGWAQINYRYGSTFEDSVEKLQYDLYYIKNRSILFDLSILFNTVKIVLLRKGT